MSFLQLKSPDSLLRICFKKIIKETYDYISIPSKNSNENYCITLELIKYLKEHNIKLSNLEMNILGEELNKYSTLISITKKFDYNMSKLFLLNSLIYIFIRYAIGQYSSLKSYDTITFCSTKYITREMFETVRNFSVKYYLNNYSISQYDSRENLFEFMNKNLMTYDYYVSVCEDNTDISDKNINENNILNYLSTKITNAKIYNFTSLIYIMNIKYVDIITLNYENRYHKFHNNINSHYNNLLIKLDKVITVIDNVIKHNIYNFEDEELIYYNDEYYINFDDITNYFRELLLSKDGTKFLKLRSYINETLNYTQELWDRYDSDYVYNNLTNPDLERDIDFDNINNHDLVVDSKISSKTVKRMKNDKKYKKKKKYFNKRNEKCSQFHKIKKTL